MNDLIEKHEPIQDCDCGDCSRYERNRLREAIALAYGHLWHVNNEPMAPVPLRSPEKAAYEARKVLRDLMTHEQRGEAINKVQQLLTPNV